MARFEPEAGGHTPRPSRKLPDLGHHATFRPGETRVHKTKPKRKRRPQHQPSRPIGSLTPGEQVVERKQSRKVTKSESYGRIAHLERKYDDLQQEYYVDPTGDQVDHVHIARTPRFWPAEVLATPQELFAHDSSDMDLRQGRPARMARYGAPSDEILLYTAASCLSQHDAHGDRRAASSCIFKPTGLHPSERRSVALRVEHRGPTGQIHPQEINRAHIRAAILALQCRDWREEGWSSVVIASVSQYLVEGITNWVEIWQENGWRTSRDTGDNREGDAVANQDLWETLLQELSELSARGLEVKFWPIIHGLNKEAQAEATRAAKTLEGEESFRRYRYV